VVNPFISFGILLVASGVLFEMVREVKRENQKLKQLVCLTETCPNRK
jgi:hypothetical protein